MTIRIVESILATAGLLSAILISPPEATAQMFTRISTGPAVTDGGASRSVNWIDFDNDGHLDLYVSNGLRGGQPDYIYRNNGDGSFQKITQGPIVNNAQPSVGGTWGDYDNDGDPDCFVVAWYDSNSSLYAGSGTGTFTQIDTGAAVTARGYSEAASWGDYDNDGLLDLCVTNSASALNNRLYHNDGDGYLVASAGSSPVTDQNTSRGVNWVDYDNDGDADLFVANEESENNSLYRNMLTETGSSTFSKITAQNIVTDGGSSWSGSWGDYDNDGDQDLFVANWGGQKDFLYRNNNDGSFTRVVDDTLVNEIGWSASSGWGDMDNDGDLDLFLTSAYGSGQLRNSLYRNLLIETGDAHFEKVDTGSVVTDLGWSYGCSWGDYDEDGDLDLFVAKTFNENENNALYRNDNVNGNHFLQILCRGVQSNRSGIGAKVLIRATISGNTVWQMREVSGQGGYAAQNLEQHFGLGDVASIDSLKIEWPSGVVDVYTNVAVDRRIVAKEGEGITTSVPEEGGSEPQGFRLQQNYPNPFNPSTSIRFSLSKPEYAVLEVFDLLGREVATLAEDSYSAGTFTAVWNAGQVQSGFYFYRLTAGEHAETRRMLLLR
ncbi:MAG: FG-GAP-like repeat-containing protein [Bacteroidota bacterium]